MSLFANQQNRSIGPDEILLRGDGRWLHFSNPQRVIQAAILEDVLPALHQIEDLVRQNEWHAAGFLSYEAAPAFDNVHKTTESLRAGQGNFPYLWFGLYPPPRIITLPEPDSALPALTWLPSIDRGAYNAAIDKIRELIADGQTYQVNYTMRLRTEFKTDPWNFFLRLAQTQNNHAAYLDIGSFVICSASPELFFRLDGENLTCRPMKGTMPRGRTTFEDAKQAQAFRASEKNRAENVMIVDMVRNDLGRIARIGSVNVPELFTVEKYPTLWQMTSTVTAKTNASLVEIFTALFPCASITGAPKVSTMRIISELETTPRRIYTGTVGYLTPAREARFNVAIRTALIDRDAQTAEYGVGGGIVWDSTSTDEYAEALLKAGVLTESPPLFSLLETLLWSPGEGFFLQDKHVARLLDSAEYFDFLISKEIVESYLHEISTHFTEPRRVRLLLDKNGSLSHEAKLLQRIEEHAPFNIRLAAEPIDSTNRFLYHKTTHREVYTQALGSVEAGYDDVLLYNERNELTEFTIGNLVVEMNGRLFTPPISCGLLAGTFRAHLLEVGQVSERIIRVEELKDCAGIFLVNSVRKWQAVTSNIS